MALYPNASTGVLTSTNAASVFTLTFTRPGGSAALNASGDAILDARSATVVVVNSGTAQPIVAATLRFTETIAGQTINIDYPLSAVAVAHDSLQSFEVPLSSGILKNVQLLLTFAAPPVAGSGIGQLVLRQQAPDAAAVVPETSTGYPEVVLVDAAGHVVRLKEAIEDNSRMLRQIVLLLTLATETQVEDA